MGEGSPVDDPTTSVTEVASEAAPTRRKPFSGDPFKERKRRRRVSEAVSEARRQGWVKRRQHAAEPATETTTGVSATSFTMNAVDPQVFTIDASEPNVVVARQAVSVPQPEAAPGMPPPQFWMDLIDTLKNNKLVDQEVAATLHAQAMKKALRPENEVAPGISVYNPKGETKYPRPKPTHIYMLGPYPIADPGNYDTCTWSELELLNQLKPGDYVVTRADNSPTKISIRTEYASNGTTPYKSTIVMPMATDDEKNNWPPLLQLLTEVVTGESPMTSITRYQNKIAELEAKLAAVTA